MFLNYWLNEVFNPNHHKMAYRSNFNVFELDKETGEEKIHCQNSLSSFEFYGNKIRVNYIRKTNLFSMVTAKFKW